MAEKAKITFRDLNKRQHEIFNEIVNSTAKYHVIRSSRQSGKSFLLLRLAIYFIFKERQKGAIVSASDKQFKKLWNDLLELLPNELVIKTNRDENIIYFSNGSTLQFFTAGNVDGGLVGSTFDFLICDEVALYPQNALSYITPVLSAKQNGKAIFASTPRGKNEFYQYCLRGMDPHDNFHQHYRMSYLDNKFYDLREVEAKRKTMVESIFKSEYLAEFVFGSSSVFGEFAQYQKINKWIEPDPNDKYFAAIDVSGDGEDSTILTIINSKGEICFMYECKNTAIPAQAEELIPFIRKYNAVTKVEKNGLGQGLLDTIQLYIENVSGFINTNDAKNDLVLKTKLALFNGTLILPSPDLYPKLDNEMSSYVVDRTLTGKLTYHHEKGFHDDSVDSMMIANYLRELWATGTDYSTYDPEEEKEKNTPNIPSFQDIKDYMNGEYDEY